MARRRFFVESVQNGQARITGHNAHHLIHVLRAEPGQKFEICDNHDVYLAEIESARKDLVAFTVLDRIEAPEPSVHTILLASLIKFDRFEWLVEKATEFGVSQIVPVIAERTEKGLERAADKRLERWKRIGREASEQSRRARLPDIQLAIPLLSALKSSANHRFMLDEEPGPPILAVVPAQRSPQDCVAILLGPEGGWTGRERAAIAECGWKAVSLGPQILRAETAAIAALAIINAAWLS